MPALRGETARDPRQLIRQTDDCLRWAAGYEEPPPGVEVIPEGRQRSPWSAMTARLESLRDQLDAALDAIDGAAAAVQAALALRDRAMRTVNHTDPTRASSSLQDFS